jgi:hypothetical protein
VEKNNLHLLLVGMWISAATMEISIEAPQKINIDLPYDLTIQLVGSKGV